MRGQWKHGATVGKGNMEDLSRRSTTPDNTCRILNPLEEKGFWMIMETLFAIFTGIVGKEDILFFGEALT
jgi:hypothetical protein